MKGDINIMKFRMKKITALMAAAVLGASTFGSVSVMAAESTEAMAVPADEAGMAVDGEAVAADGDAIPSDLVAGPLNRPRRLYRYRILMSIHSWD